MGEGFFNPQGLLELIILLTGKKQSYPLKRFQVGSFSALFQQSASLTNQKGSIKEVHCFGLHIHFLTAHKNVMAELNSPILYK